MACERVFGEASDDFCDADEDGAKMHDECGVFGCVAAGDWPTELDLAHIICLGLLALQHRGQESAGIVTGRGEGVRDRDLKYHKGMGLVSNVFNTEIMTKLKGNLGIGHTRYSTTGVSELLNCQPFIVHTAHGVIALAHNGELVNSNEMRRKVLNKGVGLTTTSDSEIITQLLSVAPDEEETSGPNWPARIRNLMLQCNTAYSLLVMYKDVVYGVRDPYGNRPLCIGQLNLLGGSPMAEGYVVSSESCAFRSVGASHIRDVYPGEIVQISKHGITSMGIVPRPRDEAPAFCIFEYVYFARPDSIFEEQMVYMVRKRCGMQLAIESPVEADIISTVPESATPAALGFAEQSGIPYAEVLCKNRYVGRTFIQPSTRLRQLAVAKKFGALRDNFAGKRIVLVDDSIVRGNTIGPIIKMLKDVGAIEVHIRIASPPIKHPCYMGINIPTKEELIANKLNSEQLAAAIGAKSLVHLSVEGLVKAVQEKIPKNGSPIGHCKACLTGEYPVQLQW